MLVDYTQYPIRMISLTDRPNADSTCWINWTIHIGLHSHVVVSTVTSQLLVLFLPFCLEKACFLRACLGFLWVLQLSTVIQKHACLVYLCFLIDYRSECVCRVSPVMTGDRVYLSLNGSSDRLHLQSTVMILDRCLFIYSLFYCKTAPVQHIWSILFLLKKVALEIQ